MTIDTSFFGKMLDAAAKKVQESYAIDSKDSAKTLTEATMSDVPHELDDLVHDLADNRCRLEDVRKTWESAGFADLTPMDVILKGIIDLTQTVYTQSALLADQKIGGLQRAVSNLIEPEDGMNLAVVPDDGVQPAVAVIPQEGKPDLAVVDAGKKESDENLNEPMVEEDDFDTIDLDEELKKAEQPINEGKEISLEECEALCARPECCNLKRAYLKCLSDFRRHKPETSSGEVVKIYLTPRENLKLMFDGADRPAFAYRDGGVLI